MTSNNKDNKPKISDLLYLLTIPQIGPGRIRRLFQVFENKEEICRAPVQKLVQVEGIDLKLAAQIKSGGDEIEAERQIKLIQKYGYRYVTVWDEEYPQLLKRIPDPPIVLFYKGKLDFSSKIALAIVGTRTPSNYGKIVTREIVNHLVKKGIVIVSGMARGIDTIAHQSALQSGGETVAVLGCGLDYCYPPENRRLYDSIPQQGALVSEYFCGIKPDAVNFPRRNRIISGLSKGTLVIEAGGRSGALITAFYALNHNREVFAIPGNITNPKSTGTNRLIKQGAKLVQNVDDILEELGGFSAEQIPQEKPIPKNLSEWERKLLSCLSHEPKHIDQLVKELKEPPGTSLLTLELMGLVQQLVGKMFIRV